ncbi:hypothetical protein O181_084091 [Austropuccinia psidii MF-1]|uniref:Uncharacterized protein n=1 Tax=Austropuccinia psidii MF-1 TaxID=1389203 RepID=A0A9Q3III5_9BASI|nr:hypothetical protein [Austropuccinia psidii MF-1]
MLKLPQCPIDMLLTPPPHVCPHPCLTISSAYHAYTPTAPYRYASKHATPSPPSPLLALPCPQLTILMLLQCPLMFSIDHPYDRTMFGFCPNAL